MAMFGEDADRCAEGSTKALAFCSSNLARLVDAVLISALPVRLARPTGSSFSRLLAPRRSASLSRTPPMPR